MTDVQMIVKILAFVAAIVLMYQLWTGMKKPSAPYPWTEYEEDYEEDYEDEDMEDEDMEDDMEDEDMEDEDMEDEDMEDDEEYDMEDDMEDDEEYDMEDEDYEVDVPSMSKLTLPTTPMLSPSSKLLPRPSVQAQDFAKYAPKELGAQNFLTATQWIGVNTQGSSLRNANYDIRANPLIPKDDVGPWLQSTIDPDVYMKPLF